LFMVSQEVVPLHNHQLFSYFRIGLGAMPPRKVFSAETGIVHRFWFTRKRAPPVRARKCPQSNSP
jgi:hypothetical protein